MEKVIDAAEVAIMVALALGILALGMASLAFGGFMVWVLGWTSLATPIHIICSWGFVGIGVVSIGDIIIEAVDAWEMGL